MPIPETDLVMPLFLLKGRTAIVTGAGAGIGLAVAHAFAEAGANVVLWYIPTTQRYTRRLQLRHSMVLDRVKETVDQVVCDFNGRLDVFVANSGTPGEIGTFIDGSLDVVHDMLKVNLKDTLYCAKAATEPGVHDARRQAAGELPRGELHLHDGNQRAQRAPVPPADESRAIGLGKGFAVEWTGFARANLISPGYVKTDMTNWLPDHEVKATKGRIPMGRWAECGELKGAYLYLASDASSYTTGTDLLVDGGYCAL
ncbi:sorbitol utilization protein SOU2 [Xylaria sp. FL1042]|nr:sorbitol utilization protein SOU2 [Xylaria sp. FL1042]